MGTRQRGNRSMVGALLVISTLACGSTDPVAADCDAIAGALVTRVELSPATVSLARGESRLLQARAFSCQGEVAGVSEFSWQSSDPAVAGASPSGMVTATGTGSATITATTQNRSGTARVTVNSAEAASLRFLQQPTNAVAGAALAPAIRVEVADAQGALVTNSTNPVTLVLAASNGATLSGTTTAVPMNGVATFAAITLTDAGTYTLRAMSPGLVGAASAAFSITAGPARRLSFTVQPCPSACLERLPLAPAPQVTLLDDYGNIVVTSTAQVTVTLLGASSRTTFGGTRSVRVEDGVATFSMLTVSRSGGGLSLRAASSGLPSANSAAFSVVDAKDDDD